MTKISTHIRSLSPLSSLKLVLAAATLLLSACGEKPLSSAEQTGLIADRRAIETSGLAAAHRAFDLLWTHNDSGGQPVLYAIGTDGKPRGSVRMDGIKNNDWEDLASFELDGKTWLLIADTGDNGGVRKNCTLYVIAEPDPSTLSPEREVTATVAWRIPVVYPEGPHDCESVTVDPRSETIFLLSKRTHPPVLYSLPLRPALDGKTPAAEPIATLTAGVPQPTSWQKLFPSATQRYRAQPTAIDIAPDGHAAAVLTYGDVLLYPHRPGEPWRDTFSRAPVILAPHGLPQAEALCFSRESRSLYVTGEGNTQPLLRYKLPANARQ